MRPHNKTDSSQIEEAQVLKLVNSLVNLTFWRGFCSLFTERSLPRRSRSKNLSSLLNCRVLAPLVFKSSNGATLLVHEDIVAQKMKTHHCDLRPVAQSANTHSTSFPGSLFSPSLTLQGREEERTWGPGWHPLNQSKNVKSV